MFNIQEIRKTGALTMTKGFICLVFVTILSYMIMNVTEIIRGKDSLEFCIQYKKYDSGIVFKYKQRN